MASDLIERLRAREPVQTWYDGGYRPTALVNPDGHEAAKEIESLRTALAIERERAEKAERELRLKAGLVDEAVSAFKGHKAQLQAKLDSAEASLADAKWLLKPFADNASGGDGTGFLDVPDGHAARFHDLSNPTTPTLTEGDFRAAARFLAQEEGR